MAVFVALKELKVSVQSLKTVLINFLVTHFTCHPLAPPRKKENFSLCILSVDDRLKLKRKIRNLSFHCHIWIQHEKCIQMSTNKPSIAPILPAEAL